MTTATLTMTRTLPAPPDVAFAYLVTGAHLLQWWGPEGTRIGENALDFSRPGPWHATMISPGGEAARVVGEVRRVAPPEAVELTLSFDFGAAGRGPESVILFTLTPKGADASVLTLTQTGLDPAHIDDMRNKGWNSALGRLIALIAKI